VQDDNDVRKALFALSESAAHCVDADRSRAPLAAKPRIDEVACQVSEKRMPGMIGRALIAALTARDPTNRTLLITRAHEADIARWADAQVASLLSGDGPAKQCCTSLPPLLPAGLNYAFVCIHEMLRTQTVAADICRRERKNGTSRWRILTYSFSPGWSATMPGRAGCQHRHSAPPGGDSSLPIADAKRTFRNNFGASLPGSRSFRAFSRRQAPQSAARIEHNTG